MGTATRPDCTDLHVVTAPPEKVLDLQSRDPRSCTSSVSGNKRCPITPPPTLLFGCRDLPAQQGITMIVSAILIVSGAVSNPRTRNILSLA